MAGRGAPPQHAKKADKLDAIGSLVPHGAAHDPSIQEHRETEPCRRPAYMGSGFLDDVQLRRSATGAFAYSCLGSNNTFPSVVHCPPASPP